MNLRWILTLAAATLITGCNDFPNGMSRDRHHFVSTPHVPINVALVDTMTGQTLFKMDVPVNHELVIDLDHPDSWTPGLTPAVPAETMSYSMKSLGNGQTQYGQFLDSELKLPGNPVIIKVTKLDIQRPTAAATPKTVPMTPLTPATPVTPTTPVEAPAKSEPTPVPAAQSPATPEPQSVPTKTRRFEDPEGSTTIPTQSTSSSSAPVAPATSESAPAPAKPATALEPQAPAPKPKLGAADTDKSKE